MKSEVLGKIYIRFKRRGLKRPLSSAAGKEEAKTVFVLFPEQYEKGQQIYMQKPRIN